MKKTKGQGMACPKKFMPANQHPRFRLRFGQSQTRTKIREKCQRINGAYSNDESSYEQTRLNPSLPLRLS